MEPESPVRLHCKLVVVFWHIAHTHARTGSARLGCYWSQLMVRLVCLDLVGWLVLRTGDALISVYTLVVQAWQL